MGANRRPDSQDKLGPKGTQGQKNQEDQRDVHGVLVGGDGMVVQHVVGATPKHLMGQPAHNSPCQT